MEMLMFCLNTFLEREAMPSRWTAASRIIVYLALLLIPVIVVTVYHKSPGDEFAYNLGRCFALIAFTIMVLQVLLAARLKWIERPFGLNLTFPFHRRMGVFAGLLLACHPLLMAAGGGGLKLLYNGEWWIWVGKCALALLLVNVAVSVCRRRLGVTFEKWRSCHDFLGPAVLALAFIHSWNASIDLTIPVMRGLWVAFLAGALVLFVYHRCYTPRQLRRAPYTVQEVDWEADNVLTVTLAPPAGRPRFDFVPGQFQFVTFLASQGVPVEEHHFTISTSPTQTGSHASTIKASGDFTSLMGQVKPGDPVAVQAPFGRFSYLYHPEARDLVFIAGGIGITPLMSNLRHMRDTGADRRVLLLYANKTEADIVFEGELDRMAGQDKPRVEVVHILTRPGSDWRGETGRLDREKLKRFCGNRLEKSTFFLCCPPPMIKSLVGILTGLGVPLPRISYEYFSL
jgi:predicted ferric reductase